MPMLFTMWDLVQPNILDRLRLSRVRVFSMVRAMKRNERIWRDKHSEISTEVKQEEEEIPLKILSTSS